jgi:signal transduction histidine kinase
MRTFTPLVRRCIAAIGAIVALACPTGALQAREYAPPLAKLVEGRLVIDDSPLPPADANAGVAIRLPDPWSVEHPGAKGYAWYLFDWPLAELPESIYAVYLPGTYVNLQVFVNETLVGTTGDLTGEPLHSWEQAPVFALPFALPRQGANRIAIRVLVPSTAYGGLDPIVVGPASAVRRLYLGDLFASSIGPTLVSVTVGVVGFFILVLWFRRRDPAYALFGTAAILWGIHTAVSILPAPLLPQPHWAVWWHALYMGFASILCLFCLRFTGVDWPAYRRLVVAFAFAVVPVLYLAEAFDAIAPVAVWVRAVGIVLVLAALFAVMRYAWRVRNTESVLLMLAGGVAASLAVHDWVAANDPYQIREVWLVPYAALGFLLLVGWILVDRFVRALNAAERANVELERRVAEKSAALTEQLARTQEAREAAEAADRGKSRFLAAASHDLRQPLHALGLLASRLPAHVRGDDGRGIAERMQRSVDSLDGLLSSLLDVSKLDAGAVEAHPEACALDAMFERVANDFAPVALDRGLSFAAVPTRLAVRSDPLLLERIVRNLVANALAFTARGGVVVGARRRGDSVAIEIWDSGLGIQPQDRARIFEEFVQVGNVERNRARGLGLGLAIVRRLAGLLGHRIELDSMPGRGTVFRVIVERAPAPSSSAADSASIASPQHAAFRGRHVVLIEDDDDVRDAMAGTLGDWGCRVTAADSLAAAQRAIATAQRDGSTPDALVVDYLLPGGSTGIEAIAGMRHVIGREVPALLVSGASAPEDLARIKASGFVLLHKPVAPAKLRAALAYLLRTSSVAG